MAILRGIGLIWHHITNPFWQLSISSENFYSVTDYVSSLQGKLVQYKNNPSSILTTETSPVWEKFSPKSSFLSDSLHQSSSSPLEEITCKTISCICDSLLNVIRRQLCDHIPGGVLSQQPDETAKEKVEHSKLKNLV